MTVVLENIHCTTYTLKLKEFFSILRSHDLSMKALDDKSHLDNFKAVYDQYGNEERESMYDAVDEYDDEYDDTYDTNLVGADDADSADELTERRR